MKNAVLPVHSVLLYGSTTIQHHLANVANDEMPRVEGCFADYEVDEVDAFLSQLYPAADPERKVLERTCCEVMELALHFGCESVLDSALSYIFEVPQFVHQCFEDYNPEKIAKWFSVSLKTKSRPMHDFLEDTLFQNFEDLKRDLSGEDLASLLSSLPPASVLDLLRDARISKSESEFEMKLDHCTNCTSCEKEQRRTVKKWTVQRKHYKRLEWTCPICTSEFEIRYEQDFSPN